MNGSYLSLNRVVTFGLLALGANGFSSCLMSTSPDFDVSASNVAGVPVSVAPSTLTPTSVSISPRSLVPGVAPNMERVLQDIGSPNQVDPDPVNSSASAVFPIVMTPNWNVFNFSAPNVGPAALNGSVIDAPENSTQPIPAHQLFATNNTFADSVYVHKNIEWPVQAPTNSRSCSYVIAPIPSALPVCAVAALDEQFAVQGLVDAAGPNGGSVDIRVAARVNASDSSSELQSNSIRLGVHRLTRITSMNTMGDEIDDSATEGSMAILPNHVFFVGTNSNNFRTLYYHQKANDAFGNALPVGKVISLRSAANDSIYDLTATRDYAYFTALDGDGARRLYRVSDQDLSVRKIAILSSAGVSDFRSATWGGSHQFTVAYITPAPEPSFPNAIFFVANSSSGSNLKLYYFDGISSLRIISNTNFNGDDFGQDRGSTPPAVDFPALFKWDAEYTRLYFVAQQSAGVNKLYAVNPHDPQETVHQVLNVNGDAANDFTLTAPWASDLRGFHGPSATFLGRKLYVVVTLTGGKKELFSVARNNLDHVNSYGFANTITRVGGAFTLGYLVASELSGKLYFSMSYAPTGGEPAFVSLMSFSVDNYQLNSLSPKIPLSAAHDANNPSMIRLVVRGGREFLAFGAFDSSGRSHFYTYDTAVLRTSKLRVLVNNNEVPARITVAGERVFFAMDSNGFNTRDLFSFTPGVSPELNNFSFVANLCQSTPTPSDDPKFMNYDAQEKMLYYYGKGSDCRYHLMRLQLHN